MSTASHLQRDADDGAGPDLAQRRKADGHLLSNATGGVQLGSSDAAGNAFLRPESRVLRCSLCQVSD